MKTDASPSVRPLGQKFGLRSSWKDKEGTVHRPPSAVVEQLCASINHDSCTRLESPDGKVALTLPELFVVPISRSEPLRVEVHLEAVGERVVVAWTVLTEAGESHSGTVSEARGESICAIGLPDIDFGYHRLNLSVLEELDGGNRLIEASVPLIVAPDQCYMSESFTSSSRLWGPVVNLAGFSSKRNWGIGDFTDLKDLVAFAAAQGAGVVAVNSLGAIDHFSVDQAFGHLPSHRAFLNILYIDVEAIEDFQESESTRRMVHSPEFQQRLQDLRAQEIVNVSQVASEKLSILEKLYQQFRVNQVNRLSVRAQAFRIFQLTSGKSLRDFATFQALAESMARDGNLPSTLKEWPERYQSVDSEAVQSFATHNNERIEFYEYLQWQAELQLEAVGHLCLNSRLPIGLMSEVSPLVSPQGAESWQGRKYFAKDVRLAEPPRQYLADGVLIESPPFDIGELRRDGYRRLSAILSFNMKHSGAVRLSRVHHWLSPLIGKENSTLDEWAPLYFPTEEILSIIALESHRNSTMVVADADFVSSIEGRDRSDVFEALGANRFISKHTLLEAADRPLDASLPIKEVPELLELSPDEISPLSVFWLGTDLSERNELAADKDRRDQAVDKRVSHRVEVLRLLDSKKLLPEGVTTDPASAPTMTPPLMTSLISLLSRSSAAMILFRVEDLGTGDRPLVVFENKHYPQWRTKMIPTFEKLAELESTQLVMEELQGERGCFFDKVDVSFVVDEPVSRLVAIPSSTYRLQMHKDFPLSEAKRRVEYLDRLGISHLYFSPLSQSRPGSLHGYDVIDHSHLDPELGTQAELDSLSADLKDREMGIILDAVPNHMGIGKYNAWWVDVLEHGPASEYGQYFDIDWAPVKAELRGKVLLPILGDAYGKILTSGALKVVFDARKGKLMVHYYENELPLNPVSYPLVLGRRLDVLQDRLGNDSADVMHYLSIVEALTGLPDGLDLSADDRTRRIREVKVSTDRLIELCGRNDVLLEFIRQNVAEFNCESEDQSAYARLHDLLEKQAYRLAFWRVAAHEINYRRFFDINDLAGVRVEDPRAFNDMHALILKMIKDGIIQGVRIDHPDGLYDPAGYFRRLQEEAATCLSPDGEPFVAGHKTMKRQEEYPIYLLGEKILAPFERLEQDWIVHGTTGYDFLNVANGVLIDERNHRVFTEFYKMVSNVDESYRELVYNCKHLIMQTALASELNVLAHQLNQISESNWMYRDYTLNSLRHALSEVVAFFPVYRTYVKEGVVSNVARDFIGRAVRLAKRRNRTVHPGIFDFIHDVLTLKLAQGSVHYPGQEVFQKNVLTFAMKFQQFTGPVMAKSLEDTLFYKFNRFVALNEVGGEPNHFGLTIADFHGHNEERQRAYPYSMLATSTHDTKRSEDVRARLSVLSEIPDNWQERVLRWMDYNSGRYSQKDERRIPSSNDEYLIYQTLVGTFPFSVSTEDELSSYANRIEAYMLKAAREAKDHTSWINQDGLYEEGLKSFIHGLLNPSNLEDGGDPFFVDFMEFHSHVSRMGIFKSLTQTLLKLTCPGVPDFYQGNELFDFSLVDPDNRRPVDFNFREEALRALMPFVRTESEKSEAEFHTLNRDMLRNYTDGRLKLFVTATALQLRKQFPRLFTVGQYIPVALSGDGKESFIAYLREYKGKAALVVAPILVTRTMNPQRRSLYDGPDDSVAWQTSKLNLPKEFKSRDYTNVFTGEKMQFGDRRPHISNILNNFPVALLIS